jgi:glutamate dehydrogenase
MQARTGRAASEVARAYLILREVFDLRALWSEIEALDNTVNAQAQIEMLLEISGLVEHAAAWLLRRKQLELGPGIARLAPGVRTLSSSLCELLPAPDRSLLDDRSQRWREAKVPNSLALRIAGLIFLASALDITELAERTAQPLERTARVYYEAGTRFALDEMRIAARRLPSETPWQKLAIEETIDDLFTLQAEISARALASEHALSPDPLSAWAGSKAPALAQAETILRELRTAAVPDLAMLVVVSRHLRQFLG